MGLSQRLGTWINGYPDGRVLRLVHRVPIPLWRLGLRRAVTGTFLILTTTGRKSGRAVHTPLMPHRMDSSVYVWCPYGDRGQWCRNVLTDPLVTVQDASGTWAAHATRPADDAEVARLHALLLAFDEGQLQHYASGEGFGASADDFVAHKDRLHLFRLDPVPEASPTPLRADLAWVWVAAPLVATFTAAAATYAARRRCECECGRRCEGQCRAEA